jgi:hypothetical protein
MGNAYDAAPRKGSSVEEVRIERQKGSRLHDGPFAYRSEDPSE